MLYFMNLKFKVQEYPFLLDSSPWPFLMSFASLFLTTGLVSILHFYAGCERLFIFGLFGVVLVMWFWLRDVTRESTFLSRQTPLIRVNLRIGFALFVVSEIMLFFAFFWAYFHSGVSPATQLASVWPPVGVQVFDAWGVPLLNTVILLLSGVSVTWVQYALVAGSFEDVYIAFVITISLSFLFLCFQFIEYMGAPYGIADSVYGSTFYMLTGLHGMHVFVGTVFLIVCLFRALAGHFNQRSYSGFLFAAWYWHFVDAVWLFLFVSIYLWSDL